MQAGGREFDSRRIHQLPLKLRFQRVFTFLKARDAGPAFRGYFNHGSSAIPWCLPHLILMLEPSQVGELERAVDTRVGILLGSAVVAGAALVVGCTVQVPADPQGTLDRVQGSTLRVGASAEKDIVEPTEQGAEGSLANLVEKFAIEQQEPVEWQWGSEETLVSELESGELDLVIGGFTDATPWSDRAAVSRGYPEIDHTAERSLVVLVPLGENRMLSTVEAFLDRELTQ